MSSRVHRQTAYSSFESEHRSIERTLCCKSFFIVVPVSGGVRMPVIFALSRRIFPWFRKWFWNIWLLWKWLARLSSACGQNCRAEHFYSFKWSKGREKSCRTLIDFVTHRNYVNSFFWIYRKLVTFFKCFGCHCRCCCWWKAIDSQMEMSQMLIVFWRFVFCALFLLASFALFRMNFRVQMRFCETNWSERNWLWILCVFFFYFTYLEL